MLSKEIIHSLTSDIKRYRPVTVFSNLELALDCFQDFVKSEKKSYCIYMVRYGSRLEPSFEYSYRHISMLVDENSPNVIAIKKI